MAKHVEFWPPSLLVHKELVHFTPDMIIQNMIANMMKIEKLFKYTCNLILMKLNIKFQHEVV